MRLRDLLRVEQDLRPDNVKSVVALLLLMAVSAVLGWLGITFFAAGVSP